MRGGGKIRSVTEQSIPPYDHLMWPTLVAVLWHGGSASISEIVEAVIRSESYTEAQQAVLHGGGPRTELEYRLAWARTYLKGMGLLTNSSRGVWALTEAGAALIADSTDLTNEKRRQIHNLRFEYVQRARQRREPARPGERLEAVDDSSVDDSQSWRDMLLEALMSMTPDAFERLAQRLLREAGFISATVTGRSGDGGIDGLGVYRLSLVSFPVFYQCKRYRGSVGSGAVRDFRGAMAGRGDKGLLITTGTFTTDAKAEATRDGAPPVDLIDGDALCDLLKQYDLGVRTVQRTVEDVSVDSEFFAEL